MIPVTKLMYNKENEINIHNNNEGLYKQVISYSKPIPVRRLRVSFKNDVWNIDKDTRIDKMIIPTSETVLSSKSKEDRPRSRTWFEVKDRSGQTLYGRFLPDLGETEIFNGDGTISSVSSSIDAISLEVVIPDFDEEVELYLFSNQKDLEIRKKKYEKTDEDILAILKLKQSQSGRKSYGY